MKKKNKMSRERNRNTIEEQKVSIPESVKIERAIKTQETKNSRNKAAIERLSATLKAGEDRVLELSMKLEEKKAKETA